MQPFGRWRGGHQVAFVCNICGAPARAPRRDIGRETRSCSGCGSTVRFRSVIYLLSTALFGRPLDLPDFPADRRIRGIGLSDWPGYAGPLAQRLDYQNTYLHTAPLLDITCPPAERAGTLDFLISSDVFEHVPDSASRAFDGAFALLKPGGWLVLTVPYTPGRTIEHYPGLQAFTVARVGERHCLAWQGADGTLAIDPAPVFHGGPGQTLEMRVFGEQDLLSHLRDAGFAEVEILRDPVPACGIYPNEPWSLPIRARKPG